MPIYQMEMVVKQFYCGQYGTSSPILDNTFLKLCPIGRFKFGLIETFRFINRWTYNIIVPVNEYQIKLNYNFEADDLKMGAINQSST